MTGSDFTFSLDDNIVDFAHQTFWQMYQQGLVYRGQRLVNYCPKHGTSFADREVEYQQDTIQLYFIQYPTVTDQGQLTVATTRPETMLADTAVAVNPADERYRRFWGQQLKLPLTNRTIPVVADKAVDVEFGTGALKITPGHDFLDGEIGQRHQLPVLDLLDDQGCLKAEDWVPAKYQSLTVDQARSQVVADLKQTGLLVKTINWPANRGHCYKCQTVLEPIRKRQWFVKMQPLAQAAIKALKSDQIKFYPKAKLDELIVYLDQLQDWNISRQIAWGIPIPMFQNVANPQDWRYDRRTDQEELMIDGQTYRRDPDVFDTWWSSGQWPFACLNWSKAKPTKLYPTDLMETGTDILRAWVSRMVNLGLFVTDQLPFRVVYLHGMVVDEKGQKMSKSKGNVVNPMTIVADYGADALRLGLIQGISPGQPQPFSLTKIKTGQRFCNKLWNIGRFLATKEKGGLGDELTPADHWIAARFNQARQKVTDNLDHYRLNEAYEAVYQFIWHDLADWYLEASKVVFNRPHFQLIFENSLRLVHPWAPFVSEVLWGKLAHSKAKPNRQMLIDQVWGDQLTFQPKLADRFDHLIELTNQLRHYLTVLAPKLKQLTINQQLFTNQDSLVIQRFGQLTVEQANQESPATNLVQLDLKSATTDTKLGVLMVDQGSLTAYQPQLQSQLDGCQAVIDRLQARLDNQAYRAKAPKKLINQSQQQLDQAQTKLAWLQQLQTN